MAKSKKRKKHSRLRRFFWRVLFLLVLLAALAGAGLYGMKHYWLARLEYGAHYQPGVAAAPRVAETSSDVSTSQHQFGIAFGGTLQHEDDASLMTQLGDTAHLGFAWIRFDIEWETAQSNGPGTYDWSAYDRIVSAARQQGLQSLPTLAYAPEWARLPACKNTDKCAPANPKQFADFAHAAAAHFASQGVSTWEIWNEPNLAGFWRPQPNPHDYTQLLKTAYPAIKSADPNATVLLGGLASLDDNPKSVEQLSFLKNVYQAGGKSSFDAVATHPYSFPVLPSTTKDWSGWSKMNNTAESVRRLMTANGDIAKLVWATEFGAPTNGPGAVATRYGYNVFGNPDHVDEQFQADTAADAIHLARSTSWMGPLFWYSYQDQGTAKNDNENFFGLLRANGTHKPAYDTFLTELSR